MGTFQSWEVSLEVSMNMLTEGWALLLYLKSVPYGGLATELQQELLSVLRAI